MSIQGADLTLDQWKAKITALAERRDQTMHDICGNCSQARKSYFCCKTLQLVCDNECTALPDDNRSTVRVVNKMKAIQDIMKVAKVDVAAGKQTITTALDKIQKSKTDIEGATTVLKNAIKNLLTHIIAKANEQAGQIDKVVDDFYPELKELRASNLAIFNEYTDLKNKITDLETSLNGQLSTLETIQLPTATATPVTILRLDQPTFLKGVDTVSEIRVSLQTLTSHMQRERLHDLPVLFTSKPEDHLHGLMSKLFPLLTSSLPSTLQNILPPSQKKAIIPSGPIASTA